MGASSSGKSVVSVPGPCFAGYSHSCLSLLGLRLQRLQMRTPIPM
jgi:hypothetical protein